jgi:hypothetical protein
LSQHCDIDIANMGVNFPVRREEVALPRFRRLPVQVGNLLSATKGLLPNRLRTPFYTSDIPRAVRGGGTTLFTCTTRCRRWK